MEIPKSCIWRSAGKDSCNVKRCHFRDRKTGPCHPLAVVKCHHGPAFTLYPPGYSPYQRCRVAPVDSTGNLVRIVLPKDAGRKNIKPAWEHTVLKGAIDASQGISWSRKSPVDDPRRRRTQRRHMVLAATLLGLATELDETIVQRIAECLGIAYLMLFDLRQAYKSALTYHGQGAAIVSAVELIPINRTCDKRLLQAGFIGGLWGRPQRCDPG